MAITKKNLNLQLDEATELRLQGLSKRKLASNRDYANAINSAVEALYENARGRKLF